MPKSLIFAIIGCLVGGGLAAIQAPTNALLARPLNSPVNAALMSFAGGTLVLLIAVLVLRVRPDYGATAAAPWYAWMGGLYGAVFVVAAAYAIPRIGVASAMTLFVAGQLLISVLVDHFGGFGVAARPVNLTRLAGLALVIGGVVLVRRG